MNLHDETRSLTIRRHVEDFLRKSATSWESFTDDVVTAFHARVAKPLREIEFKEGGDTYKRMRANAQTFKRMVLNDVRLPADIEEAIVVALPEDEQESLLGDLAARYGLLAVPMGGDESCMHEGFALLTHFIKRCGSSTELLTHIFDDGVLSVEDDEFIPPAIEDLRKLEAKVSTARGRLEAYLARTGKSNA